MARARRIQPAELHAPPREDVALSTNHVAQMFGVDQSTLHHYVKRGVVSPLVVSSGRKVWRMEDLCGIAAYRRSRGLSDAGLVDK